MKPELQDVVRIIQMRLARLASTPSSTELVRYLTDMDPPISTSYLPEVLNELTRRLGPRVGLGYVPPILLGVLAKIAEGSSGDVICDPWAGFGFVLAAIRQVTQAQTMIAITRNESDAALGRLILPEGEWKVGDPLNILNDIREEINIAVSVLPIGARHASHVSLAAGNGSKIELHGDLGGIILAAYSHRLASDGLGLFVVPPAFFFSPQSVLRRFDTLGLGIVAALELPSGAFAPYMNISTYLVVVKKGCSSRMFVAQLSAEMNTNLQIIENLHQDREGANLDLGKFVDPLSFSGMAPLRTAERLQQAERSFGFPALRLDELATAFTLGRTHADYVFPQAENAIFIPLVGISNVVDSMADATLKAQNYAQVVLDPARTDARFVSRFLNSELGKEIRELNKSGNIIPKLTKQTLARLRVNVPDLETQQSIVAVEGCIAAEGNTLLGLQNELSECRRELWRDPRSQGRVRMRIGALATRLSGDLKEHVSERLDQWFETLPFPLASILRAWQATPNDDFKTKYEHLLHFFEASSEFLGIILLSAFTSREQIFASLREGLSDALKKHNLSFRRATFGTWKVVNEYLGKQIRQRMSKEAERTICMDMFADPNARLPEMLSRIEIVEIISSANNLRNKVSHGGVVGQQEAQDRNEQLLAFVQKFRDATGDAWTALQLIRALHCRPRRGLFENEVAVLTGSNSEFVKETRSMAVWLDVERLYIIQKDAHVALQLLPLIQLGPSPSSARNACYFFNRIERDELRYVSYHFIDQPEHKWPIGDAGDAGPLLEI